MVGVTGNVVEEITSSYTFLVSKFPNTIQIFLELFLWSLLVFFYAWVIWIFYRSVSKKNILGLNLNKYNKSEHPLLTKIMAGILYFIEYILILPFLIFVWFGAFTILLIILAENIDVETILKIAIVIIATIRMTSYYKEDLSRDIAKMLPLALLAIMITNPTFFANFTAVLENLSKIPLFLNQIGTYLGFIITLEVILRFFDFIFSLFGLEEIQEEEKKK